MKKIVLLTAACFALGTFQSCSVESMGAYSHSFAPFGKSVENTKELKSNTLKPDDSLSLKSQ